RCSQRIALACCNRECGLSRVGYSGPLVADHHRENARKNWLNFIPGTCLRDLVDAQLFGSPLLVACKRKIQLFPDLTDLYHGVNSYHLFLSKQADQEAMAA